MFVSHAFLLAFPCICVAPVTVFTKWVGYKRINCQMGVFFIHFQFVLYVRRICDSVEDHFWRGVIYRFEPFFVTFFYHFHIFVDDVVRELERIWKEDSKLTHTLIIFSSSTAAMIVYDDSIWGTILSFQRSTYFISTSSGSVIISSSAQ